MRIRNIMLYEFRKGVIAGIAKKIIQNDCAPVHQTVKKRFGRFSRGDFSLNVQPRPGRPTDIDEVYLLAIAENKPKVSTEVIAMILKIDMSTTFRRLKRIGFKKNDRFWLIENRLFSTRTTHVSKSNLQTFKSLR